VQPIDAAPIPETLDWNLWLGVAPSRPYHPSYHPKRWRRCWEFGSGRLGDLGCHIIDAAFYALSLDAPISVVADCSDGSAEYAPVKEKITWEFGARGEMPPVTLTWYGGDVEIPRPAQLEETRSMSDQGGVLIGEKGTIMWPVGGSTCESPRFVPESLMQDLARNKKLPPKTIPRVPEGNHWQEWIDGCKGGPLPGSNFDYSGPLSEVVTTGNVAIRAGQKIEWNTKKLKVTNLPEANQFIRKSYRIF
jgi:predicted dehydrogenase